MPKEAAKREIVLGQHADEMLEMVTDAFAEMSEEQREAFTGLLNVVDSGVYDRASRAQSSLYHEVNAPGHSHEGMRAWRRAKEDGITSGYKAGSTAVTAFVRNLLPPPAETE